MVGIMILTKDEKQYLNIMLAKGLIKPEVETPFKKVVKLLSEKIPLHEDKMPRHEPV